MIFKKNIFENDGLVQVLKGGGVAVMPTDTIYGLVGRAQNESTVNRIYEIRKRAPNKPCIILIADIKDLQKFSINISTEQEKKLKEYWFTPSGVEGPAPVSIILDCHDDSLAYLHRGIQSLAFRLPAQEGLQELLSKTGPLIAPSANIEGLPPAHNIAEAKKYFGNAVDLYIDAGEIKGKASSVIKLHQDGKVETIRE